MVFHCRSQCTMLGSVNQRNHCWWPYKKVWLLASMEWKSLSCKIRMVVHYSHKLHVTTTLSQSMKCWQTCTRCTEKLFMFMNKEASMWQNLLGSNHRRFIQNVHRKPVVPFFLELEYYQTPFSWQTFPNLQQILGKVYLLYTWSKHQRNC